jgi:glutamine amidotransferase
VTQVSLIDYGAGNLASVVKGLRAAGAVVSMATVAADLNTASALVIPGVGHFEATRALDAEWRSTILARIDAGAAVLGICLGMQWLYDGSAESPELAGLGVFAGTCQRIPIDGDSGLKVPHVGWNTLEPRRRTEAMGQWLDASVTFAYFTHSYAAPVTADTIATTTHGVTFASAVARGRVWGAQWHPEKSGDTGLQLLRNFVAIASGAR